MRINGSPEQELPGNHLAPVIDIAPYILARNLREDEGKVLTPSTTRLDIDQDGMARADEMLAKVIEFPNATKILHPQEKLIWHE